MDWVALRWLFSNLLMPPALPLLLTIAGFLLLRRVRGPRDRRSRVARALLAFGLVCGWVLSMPLGAQLIARAVEGGVQSLDDAQLYAALAAPAPPGAIVILAGGITRDERERPHQDSVNGLTLQRLAYGARLARISGLPILLSGGLPPQRAHSEAELMARVLSESFGLHARWIEGSSRDTAGNARESARQLGEVGVQRIVLVTHAYHMRRAQASFEAAGLQVLAAPHNFLGGIRIDGIASFLPSAGAVHTSWLALHEALGLAWYRLRGHA